MSKDRIFKLIKKRHIGFGLVRDVDVGTGVTSMTGKFHFKCEFQGGIKITFSSDSKEEINNLEGVKLDFVWKKTLKDVIKP